MAGTDKRKQSLYFPDDVLNEIMKEAIRLDRSLSWMVQRAWRIASEEVRKFPSADHRAAAPEAAPRSPGNRLAPDPETEPLPSTAPEPVSAPEPQPGSQVRDFISGKFEKL